MGSGVGGGQSRHDGRQRQSYGALRDAALAVKGDRIAWIGSADEAFAKAGALEVPVQSCSGLWMLPGLIDCHTHLVYGGNRVEEYEMRLCGASYEEISRSGGGIQSTVNATRSAGGALLLESAMLRAERLMSEGVTTIEVKSGYGLELDTERRALEAARELGRRLPLTIRTTYLGLHALPREYREQRAEFVAAATGPWLEQLVAAGLVDAVDAFCESIAFTLAETEMLLRAARNLGLPAHVHAGQLTDMGAAELAARHGALSADHLEYLERRRRRRACGVRHGGRHVAECVLHAAPNDPAACVVAPGGGRRDGCGHRLEPRHLSLHVAALDAQHGVYAVRLDAGRGSERSHAPCCTRFGDAIRHRYLGSREARRFRLVSDR
jgi:imidazolonepropionase-like amidohydrolase